jgi:hypothetical protein
MKRAPSIAEIGQDRNDHEVAREDAFIDGTPSWGGQS